MPEYVLRVKVDPAAAKSGGQEVTVVLDKIGDRAKATNQNVRGVDSALRAVGEAAKAVAAFSIFRSIIRETVEAQASQAQLVAALKSTRGASAEVAESLSAHAQALSRVTAFGDEAVIGAQSLLLTFTRVGGETFPRATQAILDMSVAMGQDLKSSALQIGKALNEPVEGLTALSRAGVQFTSEQEVMIKKMVEAGNVAGAQAIILRELETQFGNSAAAARDTLGGALAALKNSWGDLIEKMGEDSSGGFRVAIERMVQGLRYLEANWSALEAAVFSVLAGISKMAGLVAAKLVVEFKQVGGLFLTIAKAAAFIQPQLTPIVVKMGELLGKTAQAGAGVAGFFGELEEGLRLKADEAIDRQATALSSVAPAAITAAAGIRQLTDAEKRLAELLEKARLNMLGRNRADFAPQEVTAEIDKVVDRLEEANDLRREGLSAAAQHVLYVQQTVARMKELGLSQAEINRWLVQNGRLAAEFSDAIDPGSFAASWARAVDQFSSIWRGAWREFVVTGKVSGDQVRDALKATLADMLADFLARWARALAQWLAAWIAKLIAAKAAEKAANLGGSANVTGGGGGLTGSLTNMGMTAGAGGASGGGASASSTASMLGGALVIAWALYVVYKGFIEDHKTKFASMTVGGTGQVLATAAHGTKYMKGVQDAVAALLASIQTWMKDMDVMLTSFGTVTVRHEASGWYVSSNGLSMRFQTAEEALSAAQAMMIRFGEFAESVPPLVRAAIQGTRDMNMEALNSNIAFARELSTQNLTDVALEMQSAIDLAASQWARAVDLFRMGTAAFAEAAASISTRLVTSLRAQYNALTGTREDPEVEQRRREQAYNAELKLAKAQLLLWLADIQAKKANYEATRAFVAGMGHLAIGALNLGEAMLKGGGMFLEGVDAVSQAYALAEQAINDALAALPPEVEVGSTKPRRGGGDRASRGQGSELRQMIEESNRQTAYAGISDFGRAMAETNRKWDDAIKNAGLSANAEREAAKAHAAAIKAANGNAEAIKKADAEYQRQLRNIARTRDEIADANVAREREIELLKKQELASIDQGTRDLGGAGFLPTAEIDQVREAAQSLRDRLAELAATGVDVTDRLRLVGEAEKYRLDQIGMGLIDRLYGYLKDDADWSALSVEHARQKVELEFRLIEAQLRALNMWDEATQRLFGAAHDAALAQASAPPTRPDSGGGSSGGDGLDWWRELQRQQEEQARQLADVNKALRDFKRSLALDELSPLTPVQRLQEAEQQYRATFAAAQAGDLEAARRFPRVFQDFFREMQRFGGTDARYLAFWNEGQAFLDQLIAQTEPAAQPLSPSNYPGPTAGQQAQQNAAVVTRLQNVQGATEELQSIVTTSLDGVVTVLQQIRDGVITMTTSTDSNAAAGSRFAEVA